MEKHENRSLTMRLQSLQISFSRHLRSSPKVRRRVILLLFYLVEIFGKQITNAVPESFLKTSSLPLECNITGKEALSAFQRAQSNFCKQQIQATACKNSNDSLYYHRLPRYCVNSVTTYGRHLGCFKDDEKVRILADSFALFKHDNSPSNCVDKCLQSGFQYAGVQYSIECFCGNTKPSENLRLDSGECNMDCPMASKKSFTIWRHEEDSEVVQSDSQVMTNCGGYFAMNVYETGVFHDPDAKANVISFGDLPVLTEPVKPVRIVFLLTLNGRAYRQVMRLIKNLFRENHFFYIHVDARQDYLYRELLSLSRKLPNHFRFVTNRHATIWGGASLLTVLLSAMEDLVTHADDWNWHWDYVINLSESDFPLKTTEQLEKFLNYYRGRNFVKSHGRDVQKFIQKQGLDKTFFECENRMWRVGDRRLPKGIVIDGGSDWIALHHEFVHYIVHTNDSLVEGLKTLFRYTLLPAESFFHTVLRNSAFCSTFVDNNLHVTNWKRKLGCKCQYRNVVDWCGCSPNDFRLADWQRLQLTENRLLFFGRKFESVVSQGIVNNLEAWIYPNRSQVNSKTSDRYWQSIFHRYDLSPKFDDAVMTLGYSLSRRASARLTGSPSYSHCDSSDGSTCSATTLARHYRSTERSYEHLHSLELVEMSLFLQHDFIQGIIVRFQAELPHEQLKAEAWYTFKTVATENPSQASEFHGRIHAIHVGLDYDQKEQIFRHFSRAMGPYSEPVLAYNCISNESFNATFIWISPAESVQATVNITVPEGSTSNFIKPTLATPLLSGQWSVQILAEDGVELVRVEFLIFPLQFHGGKPISSTQHGINHFHPPVDRPGGGSESEISSLELIQWIDSLSIKHYDLEDLCLEEEQPKRSQEAGQFPACHEKEWSSLYPDPKSEIHGIDKLTGFLVP